MCTAGVRGIAQTCDQMLLFTLTKVTFSDRGWPPVFSMKSREGDHLQSYASNQFGAIQRWYKQVLRIWQNSRTKARSESTSFPNGQHSRLAKGHWGLLGKFHETRLYLAWHCQTMWSRLASLWPQSGHWGWALSRAIRFWREVALAAPLLRHWTKKSKGDIKPPLIITRASRSRAASRASLHLSLLYSMSLHAWASRLLERFQALKREQRQLSRRACSKAGWHSGKVEWAGSKEIVKSSLGWENTQGESVCQPYSRKAAMSKRNLGPLEFQGRGGWLTCDQKSPFLQKSLLLISQNLYSWTLFSINLYFWPFSLLLNPFLYKSLLWTLFSRKRYFPLKISTSDPFPYFWKPFSLESSTFLSFPLDRWRQSNKKNL